MPNMKTLNEYAKELQEDIKIIEMLDKDLSNPRWIRPRGQKPYQGVRYEGSGVLRDWTQK